jgi:hypothetical protein
MGDVIQEAAAPLGALLQPLPVSPSKVLLRLPECRIVVSESYHAVVFAASMGIPAVAIAGCDYYVHKFRRLARRFGPGCQVELTSHPAFERRLREAIETAWHSTPQTRQSLLHAAVRQIVEGHAAYARLFALVESRSPPQKPSFLAAMRQTSSWKLFKIESRPRLSSYSDHGLSPNHPIPSPANLAERTEARHPGSVW